MPAGGGCEDYALMELCWVESLPHFSLPLVATVDEQRSVLYLYYQPVFTEMLTFSDECRTESANPALPVVVLIHGGGWKDALGVSSLKNQARDLASFDVAVWNIEYRRVGSGGGWPTTAADVCSAVDHLSEVNAEMDGRLDLQRVVVAGHSAGGHLALWVAGRGGLPTDLPGAD